MNVWDLFLLAPFGYTAPKPQRAGMAMQDSLPMLESQPQCPACGAAMTLRTARKGKNAGGKFWGCKRYPACKGTRDAEALSKDPEITEPAIDAHRSQLPRVVSAAALSNRARVVCVEGAAVPRSVLGLLLEESTIADQRSLSQWRAEFPNRTPSARPSIAIGMARRFLRRGRIIPIADELADRLRRLVSAKCSTAPDAIQSAIVEAARLRRPAAPALAGFDSQEEIRYYEMVSEEDQGWLQRQVSLGTLTGDPDDERTQQRVDFVIAHPDTETTVIEIDGVDHAQRRQEDRSREQRLAQVGIKTVRVPTDQVRAGLGADLHSALKVSVRLPHREYSQMSAEAQWLVLCKRAHQLQIAILDAIAMCGIACNKAALRVAVELDLPLASDEASEWTALVLGDVSDLVSELAAACGTSVDHPPRFETASADECDLRIVFFTSEMPTLDDRTVLLSDCYLPVHFAAGLPKVAAIDHVATDRTACCHLLRRVFGFSEFREGQFEAVSRALAGKDSIVLLPTGSGKSAAFQLAAMLRPGACFVVDPILSLIEDQIDNLRGHGIDRATRITSDQTAKEKEAVLDLLARGEYLFCYVSPERFQNQPFRESLRVLTTHTPVSLVVIDEAHCVSEWGHDFRPAYLNLARNAREFCAFAGKSPPLMALTGTASRPVLKDAQRELAIADYEAIITPSTFDRAELTFAAIPCTSAEKTLRVRGLMEALPERFGQTIDTFFRSRSRTMEGGLIFCPFVNGPYGVVEVADEASRQLGVPISFYAGEGPKGMNPEAWKKRKRQVARQFKRNASPLLVATKAFGMGIDKPNIRFTIHFGVPGSIESYYQEAGRAGRDRQSAHCVVLYSDDYPERTSEILDPGTSLARINQLKQQAGWTQDDDITRAMFFHLSSFKGIDDEMRQIDDILAEIGDVSRAQDIEISLEPDSKAQQERGIHRLVVLGIVHDYTVEYPHRFQLHCRGTNRQRILDSFHRYMASYLRLRAKTALSRLEVATTTDLTALARLAARELVEFIYDVVERGRRRALSEMLRLCYTAGDGEPMRQGILDYLGRSEFTDRIAELLERDDAGLSGVEQLCDEIRSSLDAAEVRGQTARMLEAYPDHPGLLLLRAMSEAHTAEPSVQAVTENTRAAAESAITKYGVTVADAMRAVVTCADHIADSRLQIAERIVAAGLLGCEDRAAGARAALEVGTRRLRRPSLSVVCHHVAERSRTVCQAAGVGK